MASIPEGRAVRDEYIRLRRDGLTGFEAAAAMGGLSDERRTRYERWFRAQERGLDIRPATGRHPYAEARP